MLYILIEKQEKKNSWEVRKFTVENTCVIGIICYGAYAERVIKRSGYNRNINCISAIHGFYYAHNSVLCVHELEAKSKNYKRFWSLLILLLSVAYIRRKWLKTTHTEEEVAIRDVKVFFSFLKNDRFVIRNATKIKNETIVFLKSSFF